MLSRVEAITLVTSMAAVLLFGRAFIGMYRGRATLDASTCVYFIGGYLSWLATSVLLGEAIGGVASVVGLAMYSYSLRQAMARR